jgi:hypothetical protein
MALYPASASEPKTYGLEFSLAGLADKDAETPASGRPAGEPVTRKRRRMVHMRPGEACWGCQEKFGCKVDPEADPEMAAFIDLYDKMKVLANDDFMYKQLSEFQLNVIIPKKRDAGQPCEQWTPEMVRCHFEAHVVSKDVESRTTMNGIRFAERELEGKLFRVVDGEELPDHKTFETWLKVVAAKRQFLAVDF